MQLTLCFIGCADDSTFIYRYKPIIAKLSLKKCCSLECFQLYGKTPNNDNAHITESVPKRIDVRVHEKLDFSHFVCFKWNTITTRMTCTQKIVLKNSDRIKDY